ncbi:MAG: alcohol dehydrogenase catalytic domain-containing protein, partial [Candidatus Eremiobacteraeota bacterium]|nr:alcohol dehydrogenase catalytic domain-containing protein [Candidatus Eremiobacteraeota bacterium]
MVLHEPTRIEQRPLHAEQIALDRLSPGHVRLHVRACGVCRTDLHIVEGELPPRHSTLVPGHQIVGDVIESADPLHSIGTRVGISWLGGVDGTCTYCLSDAENLCDAPTFTGYDVNGGYAEYVDARGDFASLLPRQM